MTAKELRLSGSHALARFSPTPELDSELLLAHALHCTREDLLVHPDQKILGPSKFLQFIEQRRCGMPIAYIIGNKEFYGRKFLVSPDVLIPRPDTETLIDVALDWIDTHQITSVADIGTGSGCIAVTLACERPNLHIFATDISNNALMLAHQNAQLYHVENRIRFRQGDGMNALSSIPDLVVSNPPYLSRGWKPNPSIQFEPDVALYAKKHGMQLATELIEQCPCPLILEFDPRNVKRLSAVAASNNKTATIYNDLARRPRVSVITAL